MDLLGVRVAREPVNRTPWVTPSCNHAPSLTGLSFRVRCIGAAVGRFANELSIANPKRIPSDCLQMSRWSAQSALGLVTERTSTRSKQQCWHNIAWPVV